MVPSLRKVNCIFSSLVVLKYFGALLISDGETEQEIQSLTVKDDFLVYKCVSPDLLSWDIDHDQNNKIVVTRSASTRLPDIQPSASTRHQWGEAQSWAAASEHQKESAKVVWTSKETSHWKEDLLDFCYTHQTSSKHLCHPTPPFKTEPNKKTVMFNWPMLIDVIE